MAASMADWECSRMENGKCMGPWCRGEHHTIYSIQPYTLWRHMAMGMTIAVAIWWLPEAFTVWYRGLYGCVQCLMG